MAKRLHQDKVTGPNGESLKVNWMPDGRVRLDFENCSQCVVTKLFPDPNGQTHIEVSYRTETTIGQLVESSGTARH
jgi:hypothetical protein